MKISDVEETGSCWSQLGHWVAGRDSNTDSDAASHSHSHTPGFDNATRTPRLGRRDTDAATKWEAATPSRTLTKSRRLGH